MNPTIITGWFAAVLVIFNFGTCLVMPWTRKHIDKPDEKECNGKHCHSATLGSYHKPIAILTILAIIVHIILSLTF